MHKQNFSDIQKLSYLLSCLKDEASKAVNRYDVAPENYAIVREIFMEKFDGTSAITNSLYCEFQDIEWNAAIG